MTGQKDDTNGNGSLKFSEDLNWGYDLKDGAEKDATGDLHDALYGTNGYENFIKTTIPSATVRLIKESELQGLGCTSNSCSNAPAWVYSTSYWTGTANGMSVSFVSADSIILSACGYGETDSEFGVRPVIEIPVS